MLASLLGPCSRDQTHDRHPPRHRHRRRAAGLLPRPRRPRAASRPSSRTRRRRRASWHGRSTASAELEPLVLPAPRGALRPRGGGFPGRDDVIRYRRLRRAPRARRAPAHGRGADRPRWRRLRRPDVRGRHVGRAPSSWRPAICATPGCRPGPAARASAGTLVHAAAYRNPAPYAGADVLVVGAGCTGMEIAYDLATGGAARVRLAVRTPPNILVRAAAGPVFARTLTKLPPARADAIARKVRLKELGDLTEYGYEMPEEGVFSRLHRLGVTPAIVDREWIERSSTGGSRRRRVEALDETGSSWPTASGSRPTRSSPPPAIGAASSRSSATSACSTTRGAARPPRRGGGARTALCRFVPRPAMLGCFGARADRREGDRGAAAPVAAGAGAPGAAGRGRRAGLRSRRRAVALGRRRVVINGSVT